MKIWILLLGSAMFAMDVLAQSDSVDLEKLRRESGVDPTRVQSRAGYSILVQDLPENAGIITNRFSLNLGVSRWTFVVKAESVTRTPDVPGTGFHSGFGDIRFNVLNAFFVTEKHALAGNVEFSIPTGGTRYGSGYFSATPAMTYSYTFNPTLFFAIQPQYSFDIMKDPAYPELSVVTIRSFVAKFTKSGYFFVFEPRPIFDLASKKTDFVISPIIGKALGAGFNLIGLAEIALTENLRNNRGQIFQLGVNKNF